MKRKGVVICITVAVALLGCFALAFPRTREPSYQGRTLTEWICDDVGKPKNSPVWQNASRAVQHMAPEAVPCLLKWVQAKDSRLKQEVAGWVNDYLHLHITTADQKVLLAESGFALLGDNANLAWPELIRLTQSPDARMRLEAFWCLFQSRLDKQTLMSIANRLLSDQDIEVQRGVMDFLTRHYPEEAEAAVYRKFPDLKFVPPGRGTNN